MSKDKRKKVTQRLLLLLSSFDPSIDSPWKREVILNSRLVVLSNEVVCLFSSVVERRSRKAEVTGSIPVVGISFFFYSLPARFCDVIAMENMRVHQQAARFLSFITHVDRKTIRITEKNRFFSSLFDRGVETMDRRHQTECIYISYMACIRPSRTESTSISKEESQDRILFASLQ